MELVKSGLTYFKLALLPRKMLEGRKLSDNKTNEVIWCYIFSAILSVIYCFLPPIIREKKSLLEAPCMFLLCVTIYRWLYCKGIVWYMQREKEKKVGFEEGEKIILAILNSKLLWLSIVMGYEYYLIRVPHFLPFGICYKGLLILLAIIGLWEIKAFSNVYRVYFETRNSTSSAITLVVVPRLTILMIIGLIMMYFDIKALYA